ncbi:MAG: acetylglutamate kinase [Planctomycetes bacterium]|nr:acetylglutamate kinase [Planctomycetota bacterium]
MSDAYKKAQILIEALPYFQAFDEKIVVVKLGGNAMNESSLFDDTLQDIVFMEQIGIKPILVHGGGPYISKKLKENNVGTQFIEGLRVTDQATLGVVDEVFKGINKDICDTINAKGGKAVSIHGADDGILTAEKKTLPGKPDVDLGFVGDVSSVKILRLIELTQKGIVPVISPLARGKGGQAFNVNADIAAAKIAEGIDAEKLVFMSNISGILRNPADSKSLLTSLNPEQVRELIDEGVIDGGMLPKVEASLHALDSGVGKVHIIDGRKHHTLLLEIFTPQGVGTQFLKGE